MVQILTPLMGRDLDLPHENGQHHDPVLASSILSQSMSKDDPANPINWPIHRKIYTSLVGWWFAFSVAFGLTCYTAGKADFIQRFGLDPEGLAEPFVGGFSIYLFGIAFAPIWTPHLSERVGRSLIYFTCVPICALFILGSVLSHTLGGVLVCRFFAGLFGGSSLVLIEGTFADLWSARTTNTYYAFLGTAAYMGAGTGPVAGGFLIRATNDWRWTGYLSVILIAVVTVFGLGLSETYQREIPRRRGRYHGQTRAQVIAGQPPAESGVGFLGAAKVTVLDPIVMVFTEPVVMLSTFFLLFNFAVVFQFFITVPVALGGAPPAGPGFGIARAGLAFLTPIAGSGLAALTNIAIDQIMVRFLARHDSSSYSSVEYRLMPAMLGVFWTTATLFWIGFTVNPDFPPVVPIIGTAFFVYGNAMIVFSVVPYLFDAYPPVGTLAALTAAACGRVLFAGVLPLGILPWFAAVTPRWALGTLGFISLLTWPIPFLLFHYGAVWRSSSRFSRVPSTAAAASSSPSSAAEKGHGSHSSEGGEPTGAQPSPMSH